MRSTRLSRLLVLLLLFALFLPAYAPAAAQDFTPDVSPDVDPSLLIPTIRHVAVGDSIATGVRFYFWILPYPARYALNAQTDLRAAVPWLFVLYNNQGVDGMTSSQLLQRVKLDTTLRGQLAKAGIITWNVGGNDLKDARSLYKKGLCGGADNQACLVLALNTVKTNLVLIQQELLAIRGAQPTILRTIDYYNPFVAEDRNANSWIDGAVCGGHECSDLEIFQKYLNQANLFINGTVCRNNGHLGQVSFCAQVAQAYNGDLGLNDPVAAGMVTVLDRIHPTNYGHRVIADRLRCLGYLPLKPGMPDPLCPFATIFEVEEEYEVTSQVRLPLILR